MNFVSGKLTMQALLGMVVFLIAFVGVGLTPAQAASAQPYDRASIQKTFSKEQIEFMKTSMNKDEVARIANLLEGGSPTPSLYAGAPDGFASVAAAPNGCSFSPDR